ncbi:hypothetical protein GEMRC1_007564 [Eukaryota sp. GEM-RC1]
MSLQPPPIFSSYDLSPATSPVHEVATFQPPVYINCDCGNCDQCHMSVKRRYAIIELCQTEIRYTHDIKVLEVDILDPLSNFLHKSTSSLAVSSQGPIDRILSALRSIRSLNRILRRSLRHRIPLDSLNDANIKYPSPYPPSDSEDEDLKQMESVLECKHDEVGEVQLWSVANVFRQITPFLKFYTTYIAQFEKVTEHIADFRRSSSRKLTELLLQIECNPSLRGMDISSFLIMPVQRVPRYRLLLEAVLKRTPEEHPDFSGVSEALQSVKTVAGVVNEKLREWEDRLKIIDIERQLIFSRSQDGLRLIQPHRRLVKEGILKKLTRRGSLQLKRVILFNDMLLYCGGKNLWTLGRTVESWYVTDDLSGSPFDHGLTIHTSEKTFTLYGENQKEIDGWREVLESCSRAHAGIKSLAAAVWKPDNLTSECSNCGIHFTLLKRRHHCRSCGGIYCGNCTKNRMVLRAETSMSRVCENCFKEASERRNVTFSVSQRLSTISVDEKSRGVSGIVAPMGVKCSVLSFGNDEAEEGGLSDHFEYLSDE